MRSLIARTVAGFGLMLGLVGVAQADWQLNMTPGVTPVSQETYWLHMVILWICVVIGIGVFGAMIWSMVHHRKSRGHEASNFHENTVVELTWTIIPFVILVAVVVPAAATVVNMEDSGDSDLTVRITGHQWLWEYKYVDKDVHFYSKLSTSRKEMLNRAEKGENYLLEVDNKVVLPVGKKIRFEHTSDDVIHDWWVPALSVKKDAIPGYINTNWARIEKAGTYRGQCAELCGRGHAFMPIVVKAVPPKEFKAWLKKKQAGDEQKQAHGNTNDSEARGDKTSDGETQAAAPKSGDAQVAVADQ